MVWGDNNVVRRDYAVRGYANNKRKQSFVAEFFPDVNQITSLAHTAPSLFPIPSSGSGVRRWGRGARMRAGRRDSLYDSNRDQFAAAISPKRGLLKRVHIHVRALFDAHACARTRYVCTHDFPAKMCSGLESIDRRSIRSHAFGRCRDASWHVAREERKGGENVCAPRIRA